MFSLVHSPITITVRGSAVAGYYYYCYSSGVPGGRRSAAKILEDTKNPRIYIRIIYCIV